MVSGKPAPLQLASIGRGSNMHVQTYDVLLHSSTCLSSCCLADCRRGIGLGQASDIVLKLKPARHSLKAPDPTQQEIVAVPARTSPPPAGKLTPITRAHVSRCLGQYITAYLVILAWLFPKHALRQHVALL